MGTLARASVIGLLAVTAGCRGEQSRTATAIPSSETFRAAVERVLPAVVYIQVEARPTPLAGTAPGGPFDPRREPGTRRRLGAGSGILVSEDGYILTSDHVVQQADRVQVTLHDRRQFDARVVARDPSTDVAVVRIEGSGFPVAPLGDSDALQAGDWVLALGSPLGLQFSVAAGVVSATGRAIGILGGDADGREGAAPLEHFIQTDAAINPGNSGGPLVNLAGQVVGINTAIASPTGLYFGYGFAVPINLARRVAEQLIQFGRVRRAFLGVLLDNVEQADATVYGLPAAEGAEIVHVEPGGPAERGGLQLGDVIVGIAGHLIRTVSDLQAALAGLTPGTTAAVDVIRYGQPTRVLVELGVVESGVVPEPAPEPQGPARIGFDVAEEPAGLVVASVQAYSPAFRAGVRPGQVIESVNREPVRTAAELATALARGNQDAVSLIVTDPQIGRIIINYELRP